jgi:germination protein M
MRLISIGIVSVGLLSSCSAKPALDSSAIGVYYINKDYSKLVFQTLGDNSLLDDKLAAVLLEGLKFAADGSDVVTPISGFELLSYSIEDEQILLDVSAGYRDLDAVQEILARAAIVKTLTQLPGITYVGISVEGQPILDLMGVPIGLMRKDSFIDNTGNEFSSYEKTALKLYFANADGTMLVPIVGDYVYNSNLTKEKLIVEQLIDGPKETNGSPVMGSNVKVTSVITNDSICYVNFDESILTLYPSVKSEVTIYAIVNSLVELPNVSKVQISIGGNSNVVFRDVVDLSRPLLRNLDLVVSTK